jgi:hypothetical protein
LLVDYNEKYNIWNIIKSVKDKFVHIFMHRFIYNFFLIYLILSIYFFYNIFIEITMKDIKPVISLKMICIN